MALCFQKRRINISELPFQSLPLGTAGAGLKGRPPLGVWLDHHRQKEQELQLKQRPGRRLAEGVLTTIPPTPATQPLV